MATKKFRNSNDEYGEPGPWEAESKRELADSMMPTFREWARNRLQSCDYERHGEEGYLTETEDDLIAKYREEYMSGLEEVGVPDSVSQNSEKTDRG